MWSLYVRKSSIPQICAACTYESHLYHKYVLLVRTKVIYTTNMCCLYVRKSSTPQICAAGTYYSNLHHKYVQLVRTKVIYPQICAAGTYYSHLYNTHTQLELSIPCTWNVGICYYRTIVNFYYKKHMLLKSYWIAVIVQTIHAILFVSSNLVIIKKIVTNTIF